MQIGQRLKWGMIMKLTDVLDVSSGFTVYSGHSHSKISEDYKHFEMS
jgi:hypothetical protein